MGNNNEGYLGGIMGGGSRVASISLDGNKLAGTSILDWTDSGGSYGSSTSTAMVKTGDSWDLLSYDISGFTDGFVCIEMFLPADSAHRAGGIGYSNGATLSSMVGSAVGAAGIRRQIGSSTVAQVSTAGFSTTNATFHNYGAHPVVFQLLIECSTGNAWLSYGEAGGATRYWVTGQITRSTSFDYNSPLDASTVITELHAQNYYGGTTSYVNLGADGTFGGQTSDNDTSEWFWDIPAEIKGSGGSFTGLNNTGILSLEEAGTQVVGDTTLPQLSWGGITGRSVLTEGTAAVPGDEHWDDVTLLLNGEDATIADVSSASTVLTVGSSVSQNTSTVKYGSGSVEFVRSAGVNSVITYTGPALSGDFTVELWLKFKTLSFSSDPQILDLRGIDTNYGTLGYLRNTGELFLQFGGAFRIKSNTTITTNWQHIALVRSDGVWTMYIDGVAQTQTWSDATSIASGTHYLGQRFEPVSTNYYGLDAYVDDFRLTKGVARYTGPFTPPTESFPTSLPVAATPQTLVNTGIFTLEEIYELTKST